MKTIEERAKKASEGYDDDGYSAGLYMGYIEGDCAFADIVVPVTFVHELQQTLRLCGLNELADNFKI